MKYLLSILLVGMLLAPVTLSQAATIPTFSIVSVTPDSQVTIQTSNFPAGYTFTVRMGAFGTLGVNGTVVGSTASGSGGSFQATYDIPAGLKGSAQIAIRMDSTSGGYYAYNWFYNAGTSVTPAPTGIPGTGYTGIPTFNITSVSAGSSVTIQTSNFPKGYTWTARIGAYGTLGVGGTVVATTAYPDGGSFSATYDIPAALKDTAQLSIRLESTTGGYFAYNWFYNSSSTTPAPTPIPGTGYTGYPSFSIQSVVKDTSVTIRTNNFPPNTTFTARMGAYGTLAVGGTSVGTSDSGSGGAYTVTFNIPAGLQGASRIAIRLESANGYYAYNWFYNSTWP